MSIFRCRIANPEGGISEKIIEGASQAAVKKRLAADGFFVVSIEKSKGAFGSSSGGSARKVKNKDFFSFNQEFSVLIKSGLPILAVFDAIIDEDDSSYFNTLLKTIRDDISTGDALSEAFAKHPHIFSNLYIASIQAGEKSGNLPLSIARYLEYLKKTEALRKKAISASVYPMILTIVSSSVLSFLLIFVVPTITGIFVDTGTELPMITQLIVNISHFLKAYFMYGILVIVLAVGVLKYLKRTPGGRFFIDKMIMQLPFFGELYRHYFTSSLTRTLSTVLSGGIPLVEAVEISSGTINNVYFQEHMAELVKNMEQGEGFADSLQVTGIFPKLAVRMIAAGESGGALNDVLNDIADFYDGDVEKKLTILTSSIEPILMVLMGGVIGFIVLAMYMPIFQMAGAVS